MFIKTGHLHLTYVGRWIPNTQYRSPEFKTAGWLEGQLSLSLLPGWLNEYQELQRTEW